MLRLLPLALLVAAGLSGFALLAIWQLNRLGFLLAKTEQQVQKLEREDPATGLPNLTEMLDRSGEAMSAPASSQTLAVAVLDLDAFGELKDAIGETGGEEVAVEVANRLRAGLPRRMTLGRLRNERFAVLMPATSDAEALAIAEAARDAVSRAVWIDQVIQVTACVGLALVPRDAATQGDLWRRAKLALRTARAVGREPPAAGVVPRGQGAKAPPDARFLDLALPLVFFLFVVLLGSFVYAIGLKSQITKRYPE
jgi:diguanylate cyclase (GGDEF)-like protein